MAGNIATGKAASAARGKSLALLDELRRPLSLLVYLLIALALVELYRQASFLILRITNIILIFIFAAVIAMLLTPVVDRVESLPFLKGRRGIAVLVLGGAMVLVLGVAGALLAPTVVRDGAGFAGQVPAIEDQAQRLLDTAQGSLKPLGLNVRYTIPRGGQAIGGDLSVATVASFTGVVAPVVNVLLVIVVSIYLTAQGRQLVATTRKLFPAREKAFDFSVLAIGAAVSAYVRAQLVMSLVMGSYTAITLAVLGVHYAVGLGVAVFFLELLPLVGAPIGFALAILVALTQSVGLALEATAVSLVGHAIEAYILGPRVSGKVTRIHPLVAMAALLVGSELAGILGALVAVPLAVIANIFLGSLYAARQGQSGLMVADTPGPVGIGDLPSLADQISVTPEEVAAEPELGAALVRTPPARRVAPRKS